MKPGIKYLLWGASLCVLVTAVALPKMRPMRAAAPPAAASAQNPPRDAAKGGGKPLSVATHTVRPSVFAETISATGTLRADEGVELQAETSGKVIAINFTEGSRVRKGDLLLKLNDASMRATLARATQKKELAQAQERRLAALIAQKLITQYDYDAVLSELKVQEAEIALAQAQIAETEIRAPFDGVVGLRFVSLGAYVNAATRIATLQQLDRLKIDFTVPEKYAAKVRPGSAVTFRTADGEQYQGEIYAVDPRIDSATRTVLGRAVCINQRGRLLPGAFASVEIALAPLRDAVLIPAQAIIPGLDDRSVFVMREGRAERRAIQTGARTDSTVQVLAGLAMGEQVITTGLVQLRAGQAVTTSTASP
jgi:membrane fusion protein, multidrug efflux system